MSETMVGTIACCGLLSNVLASWLYMLGGRDGKWKRRFVASLVLSIAVSVIALKLNNWDIRMVLIYPALAIGFSLGYGSDIPWKKVVKRTICAVACCAAGLVYMWIFPSDKVMWLFATQCVVATGTIILGVKNPLPAAAEEAAVCMLLTLFITLYPFVAIGPALVK